MAESRLYRVLSECPKPIFQVRHTGGLTLHDDEIMSITINRGSSEPNPPLSPTTMEVLMPGYASIAKGETLTCDLTTAAANWLAGKFGGSSSLIKPRYYGRVGQQKISDHGAYQRTSNITAVSWSALLEDDPHEFPAWSGSNVGEYAKVLMTRNYGDFKNPTRMDSLGMFGTIYETENGGTYSDRIKKYADDYGLFIREYRHGQPQIFTLAGRKSRAITASQSLMPLSRTQALAPAEWQQLDERYQRNHRITFRNSAGELKALTWGAPADENMPLVDHDLKNIVVNNTQMTMLGQSYWRREWYGAYEIPEVTVDLLYLASTGRIADRQQIGQLLDLSPGDPVLLADDWPVSVRGVLFAEGIKEQITPDSWTVTLSLVRFDNVTGEDSPSVKPRTWDQAGYEWNQSPGQWDDY